MGFKVGSYSFSGNYSIDEIDEIENFPGLYALLCRRDRGHFLVDVGQADKLKSELKKNSKKGIWNENCSGSLVFTVKYTPDLEESERKRMEQKIRNRHNPPCRRKRRLANVRS